MQFRNGFGIFLFAIVLLSGTVMAQTAGTISGVVQDESAAVIPGATVTITNLAGTAQITDTNVSPSGPRFYRAISR